MVSVAGVLIAGLTSELAKQFYYEIVLGVVPPHIALPTTPFSDRSYNEVQPTVNHTISLLLLARISLESPVHKLRPAPLHVMAS